MRTTGSIAYELAMTARGVLQYAVIGAPRIWDMAAGALAVMEAQGTVMTRFRGEKQWHPLESLVPTWETLFLFIVTLILPGKEKSLPRAP